MKLVLGRGYQYRKSVAVPIGTCVTRGEKAYWVHLMGSDFQDRNGSYGLYAESGKYLGTSGEKMDDLDPSKIVDVPQKKKLTEEEFTIEEPEEEFTL